MNGAGKQSGFKTSVPLFEEELVFGMGDRLLTLGDATKFFVVFFP